MNISFIDRIDATGIMHHLADAELTAALKLGEPLHRAFRPDLPVDYVAHLQQMANEGAGLIQLVDEGEVRAIAVWRNYLTTYCGRRFEIDDLVTTEDQRSRGYGRLMIANLEAKARELACDTMLLSSATWRVDAHRFYHRERFTIDAFLFGKGLR